MLCGSPGLMGHKAKAQRWRDVFVFATEMRNLAVLWDEELFPLLFVGPATVLTRCRAPPFSKILFPSLFLVTRSSTYTTMSSKASVLQPWLVLKDLGGN